ncbi:hypothetical protein LTR49_019285 [Elasticomyces elasticus]|nr:hypothetical protein LTR49_019285 [Elasticomyces elasticus]
MSQPTSWSTISVSKSVLETILLTHEVMPEFLDVVGCFQEKAASVDLAYCIPFVQKKQNDILEYAYGFKYPESNGRSDGGEQWSLRQGAIYHQYHVVEQRSVWIVINARPNSEALQRVSQHLAKIQSIAQSKQFPFAIDELILPAHLRMCKAYLRSHERTIIQLSTAMMGLRSQDVVRLHYEHLTKVRYIEEQCLPLKSVSESFKRSIARLDMIREVIVAKEGTAKLRVDGDWVSNMLEEWASISANLDFVLHRCTSTAQLLSDTLDVKSRREAEIQSASVFELTHLTVDDSATVQVITVITLIYLASTSVATVFGMPFFDVDTPLDNLLVSRKIWVYFAVAAPLTVATIGYWRWRLWEKRRQRERRFSGVAAVQWTKPELYNV